MLYDDDDDEYPGLPSEDVEWLTSQLDYISSNSSQKSQIIEKPYIEPILMDENWDDEYTLKSVELNPNRKFHKNLLIVSVSFIVIFSAICTSLFMH